MRYDCLIIDDEIELAETTCEYFNLFDVQTAFVTSADACRNFLCEHQVSMLLLDINLGGESGFQLCKELRQTTGIPILFISARSSEDDVLIALDIGGDDYIHKPYTLRVLLAKVKAVLKRYNNEVVAESSFLESGPIQIDPELRRASLNGVPLKLKTMEYKLLKFLIQHKNRVIAKEELFTEVWGDVFAGDGTLNVHIRHLREKIEQNPNDPQYIRTVWGIGYAFEDK
ncbi:DNA-binding response regulator [Paenibacillus sp. VTT E-133280]|uniref:response regulator transcription factor n=1 Tax=unclassified Paenibacillus TaxID=185978 RepID=UPI000BA083A7|nr:MULTISPECIES: response regulator transcription factor [unclassified Paenibacillus]MDH6369474.1 two-component system response regulator RegX3 [Paenibacillus sp. PastF-3]OZQ66641.1 DNA-binding response regulator [Paenibacillus sp. VTT E-133280]OZQ97733.1 DNA-binding response regulator [Paenibacillus sp. VTT E-133291]